VQRPSITFLEEQIKTTIAQSKVIARNYTDEVLEKLKSSQDDVIGKLRNNTEISIEQLRFILADCNSALIEQKKDFILELAELEKKMQSKMEELIAKQNALSDDALSGDNQGSSNLTSLRPRKQTTQNSEIRRSEIGAAQLKEITDMVSSLQEQMSSKLKEVDNKRKENSSQIKQLQRLIDSKANKEQIVEGQLELVQTVVQQENETEQHLD
jgi:hypothetical protein